MDCFFVGVQDMFSSRKCRYQHYQCGLWQMEIRNQSIDHLELIARVDKNLRPPTRLMKHAVFIRSSFQGPWASGSGMRWLWTGRMSAFRWTAAAVPF